MTKKTFVLKLITKLWKFGICFHFFVKTSREQLTYALYFYRSKMILDWPNCFGQVQIVLVRSKSFWLGPNHFGQVQIRLFWTNFYNSDLSRMIWTRPKWFGPNQNNFYSSKTIYSVQNHFGPIEGQGIIHLSIKRDLQKLYKFQLTLTSLFFRYKMSMTACKCEGPTGLGWHSCISPLHDL